MSPETPDSETGEEAAPVEIHAKVDSSEERNDNDLSPESDREILPLIGLGGSAGSIGVIQEFFKNISPELGAAYVVVVHLSPDYESQLAGILARCTSMRVVQVKHTVAIEANNVYVIPPGHHLTMQDGSIHLAYPEQDRGKRVAVDLFFRSLAATHRSRAVAIVFSGLDGDGAIGIKRVKEGGGVTIAQDPSEAEYEGMPQSAIETGMVDWVLPVSQMAPKLAEWIRNERLIHLPPADAVDIVEGEVAGEAALQEVLLYVASRTGHDFSHYKRATILRRIMRRLQVNCLENLPQYAAFLKCHPEEIPALVQDFLVSVTNFFRDPASFEVLSFHLSDLLTETGEKQLRIWVPGCATGEEPYSLMMLLMEQAETKEMRPDIQIFATDLDEKALRIAREGYYAATIAADVSPERLRRFFTFEEGRYRVKKEIRDKVLFAPHNVLSDAPFSRLDLVSCRNLMIYFKKETQNRVMKTFHFALRPGGRLFLGSSELLEIGDLFALRDRKHRIFQRKHVNRSALLYPTPSVPLRVAPLRTLTEVPFVNPAELLPQVESQYSMAHLHLEFIGDVAPPSVLVDQENHIVHLSRGAGRYLRFGEGKVSTDLLSIIHPRLRLELRSALFHVSQTDVDVRTAAVELELEGRPLVVSLKVSAGKGLRDKAPAAGHLLVTFEELVETDVVKLSPGDPDAVAKRLEDELQHLRSHQAVLNEDLGSSLEELRASNEELQAMNEEHRSAVEELETAQEELQATNEELITVNHELKSKLVELSETNADLQNFIVSSDIATLFLNRELHIKRYTPKMMEISRIIPGDIGRPFADLRHAFLDSSFIEDAKEVLLSLSPKERELLTKDGKWFLMRISPYRVSESEIDGVVLTFVDITASRNAAEALRQSEERYRAIVSQLGAGVLHLDLEGKVIYANRKFRESLGYDLTESVAHSAQTAGMLDGADCPFWHLTENGAGEMEASLRSRDGRLIHAHVSFSPIRDTAGEISSVVAFVVDVTERREAEDELKRARNQLTEDLAGMTRLHELNERLMTSGNLDDTLMAILSLAMEFTEMEMGLIQLKDEDGEPVTTVYKNLSPEFVAHFQNRTCEVVSQNMAPHRKRVLVENVGNEPLLSGTESLKMFEAEGIRAFQATLLVSHGGNSVGMLSTAGHTCRIPSIDALKRLDLLAWMAGDFIERARADEFLKKSETQLSAIFAGAEAGLSEISINGRFLRVNDTLCRILARSRDELLSISVVDVTFPEDMRRSLEAIRSLRESGKPVSLDKRYVRPDGSQVWANSTLSLLDINPGNEPVILAVTTDLTERKRAEAALRESREHFQRVVESVKDYAIITCNESGIITGWNTGAIVMFGYNEGEAIGQPSALIFTPEDRAAGEPEKEMSTARGKGRADDERWHLRKNGTRFWVSGVMSPLFDGGILTGYVKVARDLTEARIAESTIRESEARFRTLADAVPQLIWTNDEVGYPNYFNRRWFDYTGLGLEDSVGKGWQAVIHPDDQEESTRFWTEALSKGEIFDTRFRLRRANGEYRWFIGRNIPLHDEDGNLVGWFGTATDVEDMKRAEEALRQSETRLRITLESAEMAAWDWDVESDQVTWNEQHFHLLGLTPDHEPKTPAYFLEMVHPDDREKVVASLARVIDQRDDYQAEFRIIRADGTMRWMYGFGRAVDSADGRVTRVTGVMYDSTDRKTTETELQLAHDELEMRVRTRTAELSEALRRLQEESAGRKELEQARRELLRRLVTTQEEERRRISRELHDNLGQHMVALKFGLDTLQAEGTATADPQLGPAFDRLRHLVDALIKAAHRQAWELRPSELDHLGLEAALQHYFVDLTRRTGLEIDFSTNGPARLSPEVEIAFYRVVQEALTNVVRHAKASSVRVVLESGDPASVAIEDDGVGFVPGNTMGRLGLLGLRERLSLIGGRLEIKSTLGQGTVVKAVLVAEEAEN